MGEGRALCGGGSPLSPPLLYIGTQSIDALLLSMAYTTYGLYAVQAASLGALELVLVGTALELSVVVAEVPTGLVADVFSRRLSVLVGLCLIGSGIILMGAMPTFMGIALGSVLWGIGHTFISGAHQAWLADEIGAVQAASVYLRATQISQVSSVLGIPLGVALATRHLQLPMLVAGVGFWGLAGVLLFTMPERGYTPVASAQRHTWAMARETLQAGLATVRGHVERLIVLVITLIYGMSSEGVDRLAPLHILGNIGLPGSFADVTWFGMLNAGSFLGGAVVTWLISQSTALRTARRIMQTLLILTAMLMLATLTFALARGFWPALIALWMARWARTAIEPLMVAWLNRGLAPGVRATVLSMLGQADALGQVCGGPVLGLVGTLHTVRTALACAAVVLFPVLPLYGRCLYPRKQSAPETSL